MSGGPFDSCHSVPILLVSELTTVFQVSSTVQIRQDPWSLSSYLTNNPLWFSALVLQFLNTYLLLQVTLSYGDPENKHNVVSVGGVFGLQQDPTR